MRKTYKASTLPDELTGLRKSGIEIVQINLGDKCNQNCAHCHVEGSPSGTRNMKRATAEKIIERLNALDIKNIEFTGGAPELNPNLRLFIEKLSKNGKSLTVRTNLTVLDLPRYSSYCALYKLHKVRIIASLPAVFPDTVDQQRGAGVFNSSIKVIKKLNEMGYGSDGLCLDLVYNPSGDFLPPPHMQLREEYRNILDTNHGVQFNDLLAIVNVPIKRFRRLLQKEHKLTGYMDLLSTQYNPDTVDRLMCRSLISVDYRGHIFDCDFNLALHKRIKSYENVKFWEIDFDSFNPEIDLGTYCYACTANVGSSCHGALIAEKSAAQFDVKQSVKQYYGKELRQSSDLKTTACCVEDNIPKHIREVLPRIHDEIKAKFYGCGSPVPFCIGGLTALDVGCGTGRDCYVMSQLVGDTGFVYGIDMTKNQIEIAQKYVREQAQRFGFKKPNVKFIHDNIENIDAHFNKESVNLVTSNCVINLTENKEFVLKQIYRILKFGGEFYFSDIYADRRSPDSVRNNPVLYGECLGGALYCKDFERIARNVGFADPRVVSQRRITITNPEVEALIGNVRFYSITYRLWKLKGLEDACEDYGHLAVYRGGIEESPFKLELDAAHVFYRNKPERVCGNTMLMLAHTRFRQYFDLIGNFTEHFGAFDCGPRGDGNNDAQSAESQTCACC